MRRMLFVLALCGASALAGGARSEDKKAAPPVPPSESTDAEKKFDAVVHQAAKVLAAAKAYAVEAVCDWKTAGTGPERSGQNKVRIVADGPTKLRVEAVTGGREDDGQLLVVADGKDLTHLFTARKLYTRTASAKPLDDLQKDALTRQVLRGSGLDFLLKSDVAGHVLTQTNKVADLGIVEVDGKKLQAFRLGMTDGRDIEVRLTTGDRPVPVEMVTTVRVPMADKKTFELTLRTRLTWDLTTQPTAETFAVALPPGARKVADLTEALLDSEAALVLGKPVPGLPLATLDGAKADLAQHKDKVVVLYFWATWAAPSIADMAGLNEFVRASTAKGATVLAVAVGEKADDVKRFAAKEGFAGTLLLDPKAEALAALKTNALPAVLLVGKDGTLQAFYRGDRPNLREQVRQDLEKLLKGERLAPKE